MDGSPRPTGFPTPSLKFPLQPAPVPERLFFLVPISCTAPTVPEQLCIRSQTVLFSHSPHSRTFTHQQRPVPWVILHFQVTHIPSPFLPFFSSGSHFQHSPRSLESRTQFKERGTGFPGPSPCPLPIVSRALVGGFTGHRSLPLPSQSPPFAILPYLWVSANHRDVGKSWGTSCYQVNED